MYCERFRLITFPPHKAALLKHERGQWLHQIYELLFFFAWPGWDVCGQQGTLACHWHTLIYCGVREVEKDASYGGRK